MWEQLWYSAGWSALTWRELVMFAIAIFLLYLGIFKEYEPLLLIPIAFGVLLANFPLSTIMEENELLGVLYKGIKTGLYPSLVFLGIGAMTDFGPLIAYPRSFLFGGAAQVGIFLTFLGARLLNFTLAESASIGIIGGADGPTAIYLTTALAPELLAPIAIAAYSYMALVPVIQPKVIYLLTTKKERQIQMEQLRPVGKIERLVFPVAVTLIAGLFVPSALPLLGPLMLGNILRESGVTDRLAKTAQNELINITTILVGLTVGATANAQTFLTLRTISILVLGIISFALGTATGVLFGKLEAIRTNGKVNPMIGAAGVSAVPMAARVVHKIGQDEDKSNFLLMHAMGPNVAGVIGSAIVAGIFLSVIG
ncbi:MAG: sodium ion-translocating decarboxylase subunit beta [Firmicutes bacterium]|nr:sodium ion-translocating decarboxylase subunit beta [Bacillota bacterium]